MALPTHNSLGGLRGQLKTRLGFRSQTSGYNVDLLNEFLQQAQWELWWEIDWPLLRKTHTEQVGTLQTLYDWPDDCDPDRLLSDEDQNVFWSDDYPSPSPPYWWPMEEGITRADYNSGIDTERPLKYERRDQLEIWPSPPSTAFQFRFEYLKRLDRFTQDGDLLTVPDDRLVLLHAVANAKAHYGHADADRYGAQLLAAMRTLKGKKGGKRRYVRRPHGRRQAGSEFIRPKLIT